jgi:hypothetical protein
MKSFYDTTVIDISNKLNVVIKLIEHNSPEYIFTVNSLPVKGSAEYKFGLLDNLQFHCNVEKGAVEVELIMINERQVMPLYLHLAEPKTSWITDDWCFEINEPFYPWYHQITGQGWIA